MFWYLIKTELEIIKKYIEPAIEASRETLEITRKRGDFKDPITF